MSWFKLTYFEECIIEEVLLARISNLIAKYDC